MTPNPLKKFEKWGHEALEPTDDEIYFSILRTLNERQKDWLFKYINSIRKEAAKGGLTEGTMESHNELGDGVRSSDGSARRPMCKPPAIASIRKSEGAEE